MADRRMLTKKITDDDNFLSLSASAQALYMHLNMSADDDGFCNQVSTSIFKAHASMQDLETLLDKKYLYQFENGVIVIKHWRMANTLRKDRYKPTSFQEEYKRLELKENGAYTMLGESAVAERLTDGCQVVATTKNRLDKDKLISSSSLGASDKLLNRLTEEESEYLFKLYEDADYLIDEVQAEVDKKRRKVEKPFQYIIGYADKKGWPENEKN